MQAGTLFSCSCRKTRPYPSRLARGEVLPTAIRALRLPTPPVLHDAEAQEASGEEDDGGGFGDDVAFTDVEGGVGQAVWRPSDVRGKRRQSQTPHPPGLPVPDSRSSKG